jgi:hypothetical protein
MARPEVVAMVSASSPGRHIVAVPVDSVRPYAVRMVSNDSSSRIRRISSMGTTAAPVTASRSEDRSRSGRVGSPRIDWYSVGGPGSTVIASAAMRSMTEAAPNTAWGTIVAPRMRQARIPAL